ncbi:uncharacterized protein LAESUDRAFT_738469 [Laetiporus sulphureus 93-53]|uniref:Uncharacterized protein n=1 Tax=Laetiporus sulphureus 93-53 TaxID=1314785 RepID=A0A165CJR1_9APHY|nr:uncharacterized protein LAESUDRAFT_738469 [Laetiporus sulphureus 93-53]KZT02937.1 hypothetical protein LAESUDRAFT_738469 [Laetiporus sulphureus 93-53]
MPDSLHMQYAPAAWVPLIKSPSLRVPRPVIRPPDIHPLPDDVTAYPHVLRLEDSRRVTLAAHAARREAYLKIAPGFEPQGSPLVPLKLASVMEDLVDHLAALDMDT